MNAQIERLRAWWAGLAERERRVVGAGGVALGLILVYLLVWEPLTTARVQRELSLQAARAMAVQLEELAAVAGRAGRPAIQGKDQSLLAVVDQSRKASALTKPAVAPAARGRQHRAHLARGRAVRRAGALARRPAHALRRARRQCRHRARVGARPRQRAPDADARVSRP
jgi:type II secretory pathway component PulM